MPDLSAIATALSALNAAKDIAQAMITLRDTAAFQGKLIEFQSKLIEANTAAFAAQEERVALLERIRALEAEVAELKAWDTDKERYELKQIQTGVTAYTLKEGMENGEPPHCLCPNCYTNNKKMILQREVRAPGMTKFLICHHCGLELIEHGLRHPEHGKPQRGRTGR